MNATTTGYIQVKYYHDILEDFTLKLARFKQEIQELLIQSFQNHFCSVT